MVLKVTDDGVVLSGRAYRALRRPVRRSVAANFASGALAAAHRLRARAGGARTGGTHLTG